MSIEVIIISIILILLCFSFSIGAFNSNTVETSFGTVEYYSQGAGIPVLVAHGIFGGVDQAVQTGINLTGKDFNIIGVSRFGYLQSDLPEESTPSNQAKVYKELVDYLQLKEVVVLAVSAGGAPALKFALNYPERTKALILVGSGSPSKAEVKGPTGPPSFILNDFIFKIALSKPIRGIMRSVLFGIDKEVYNNASSEEKKQLDIMFDLLLPVNPRKPGIINDEKITNIDMNKNYDNYVLENIRVPTLIIHAEDDPMASFTGAKNMSERIPKAEFVPYKTGGHLLFGHQKEIQNIIKKFIRKF